MDLGPPPGMGYDGMRGYGHKDKGFLANLFGQGRPRNDWMGGGAPMDMGYDDGYPMPRDYGMRDYYPQRGYDMRGYDRRVRDFSPGRAWMANRGRDLSDFDEFEDLDDLLPPRRRDPLDDLDLMVSRRRDPLWGIPRRDPIDMMLERNDGPRPPRTEPDFGRGRREYRRDPRPMSADGRIEDHNANLGWSDNKAQQGPFNIPRIKSDVVEQPKYKFNSPQHQGHVLNKHDSYENEKSKNRQKYIQERLDELDDRRRERYEDRYNDRYDDRRGGGGGRGRRARRRDDDYSSEDDDDNPYHQLPAHIPKDDYDNAVRRNLHAWSQWRTGVNERGGRDPRVSIKTIF